MRDAADEAISSGALEEVSPAVMVRAKQQRGPSDRDAWRTPPFVVHWAARRWGPIEVDLAADATNSVVDYWLGPGSLIGGCEDSLAVDWACLPEMMRMFSCHAWCNPPYSHIDPWITKAIAAKAAGLSVTMLIPAMPGEQRFRTISQHATEIVFIVGRLAFLDGDARPVSGNTTGSALIHFRGYDSGPPRVLWVDRDAIREEVA